MKQTIQEVYSRYRNDEYNNSDPYPSAAYYREGHIFDADKSVNWNKNEVQRRNIDLKSERNEWQKKQAELQKAMADDLVDAIIYEYHFTETQARKIYAYVYQEYHSHASDVFNKLDDVCDFIKQLLKEGIK